METWEKEVKIGKMFPVRVYHRKNRRIKLVVDPDPSIGLILTPLHTEASLYN